MKKVIVTLILAIILSTMVYIVDESFYPRPGKIVAVEYDLDDYIIEDIAGLRWVVKGVEDLSVGDNVAMLIYNRLTPNDIFDDIILKIR